MKNANKLTYVLRLIKAIHVMFLFYFQIPIKIIIQQKKWYHAYYIKKYYHTKNQNNCTKI